MNYKIRYLKSWKARAISLLYKDDFVDLVAPVYIQEGLEWMKSYLDSNGNRNGE